MFPWLGTHDFSFMFIVLHNTDISHWCLSPTCGKEPTAYWIFLSCFGNIVLLDEVTPCFFALARSLCLLPLPKFRVSSQLGSHCVSMPFGDHFQGEYRPSLHRSISLLLTAPKKIVTFARHHEADYIPENSCCRGWKLRDVSHHHWDFNFLNVQRRTSHRWFDSLPRVPERTWLPAE
jgi:hypothetical protein